MPVAVNLYSALKHLRYRDEERVIWADALRINQGETEERIYQLFLIRRMCSQASTVRIFLSEFWDDVDDLLELVKLAAMDPALHYDPLVKPNFASLSVNAMSQQMHTSLLKFLYLPWWTRLWIVQEYALAQHKTFQSGFQTLGL